MHFRSFFAGCLLAGLPLAFLVPADAVDAQVRRCETASGTAVFTDRKCADIGAEERLPRKDADVARTLRLYRGGCSRNLQDLVYEMTAAIDARDANRLAGLYHWVGASSSGANAVMQRLEGIVDRPLVDIAPVMAGVPEDADAYYPSTIPARQPPVALRVEQTLANGSTPASTVFGLRQHFGCWWITL